MNGPFETSRKQRRAFEKLCERATEASSDDARWFAARPWRQHRMRHATAEEIKLIAAAEVEATVLAHDEVWITAVRCIAPGIRVRLYFTRSIEAPTDDMVDEDIAAAAYAAIEGRYTRDFEEAWRRSRMH